MSQSRSGCRPGCVVQAVDHLSVKSDHHQGDCTHLHSACRIRRLQISPQVSSTASLLAASCHGLCNLRASSEPHEELSARVQSSDSWRRHSERQNSRLPRGCRRAWRGEQNTSNTRREIKTCVHVSLECGTGHEESRDGGNERAIRAAEEMTAALYTERRLRWAYDLLMLSRDSSRRPDDLNEDDAEQSPSAAAGAGRGRCSVL